VLSPRANRVWETELVLMSVGKGSVQDDPVSSWRLPLGLEPQDSEKAKKMCLQSWGHSGASKPSPS